MKISFGLLFLCLAFLLPSAFAQCGCCGPQAADGDATYPLDTCVVSGEELGSMGDPVILDYEGQEVRLCCKACVEKFNADPERYLAILAQAQNPYPLATCVVSGEELGSMGDPVILDYEGQEVRLCCKGCVKKFHADPEQYLAILAEARNPYPLTTCVVSGEELGAMGDPVILNYEGQEVRLCCKGCVKKFNADPEQYLALLEQARDTYPLDTCVVSGKELGSMGDPVILDYEGQEVRLCCGGCVAKFNAHPEKFLSKLTAED